jgi:mitochondrial fission protein ELM1
LHAQNSLPLIVWIVSDGKPGHVNQSLGLAEALARAAPAEIHTLRALPAWRAVFAWLFRRPPVPGLPAPDLILGAGHATHLTLLAARHAAGGRSVVLMKPSLPRRCFDLCILPRHDGLKPDARTWVTEGAINRVRPAAVSDDARMRRGLILIGGESPHFEWNGDAIQVQIRSLLARLPDLRWTLATSRRTPADFLARLPVHEALEVVPPKAAPPDWLPARLAESGIVWVTPDSASMVYEALTAGADVGVFDLPVNPKSRVGRAIAGLADARRITRFAQWCAHGALHPNRSPLAEADRTAAHILTWLTPRN